MWKKLSICLLGVLMLGMLLVGCGEKETPPEAKDEKLKVGMALPGPKNDNGFNQSAYEGLLLLEEEMDAEINILAEKLAKSNPEAMSQLKEIFWKGTEDWDELLAERAGTSGNLVLSDFTVNAINQFKNK